MYSRVECVKNKRFKSVSKRALQIHRLAPLYYTEDEFTYTGEGGNDYLGRRHQVADQKMERNNLYLKNSMLHDVPVRVFRKCPGCRGGFDQIQSVSILCTIHTTTRHL